MNNTVNWLSKKSFLIFGFLGSVIFFTAVFVDIRVAVDVCHGGGFCGDISELLRTFFSPFVPLFIFSLVTLKLKEPAFLLWRNFSLWAIPIIVFIAFIFPRKTHGMDFFPVLREAVSFVLSIVYFVISVFLTIYKSAKKE